MHPMLFDTLTLVLVAHARNPFAAKQLLKDLTRRTPDHVPSTGKNPVFDYQKQVILKGCKLAGPGTETWLQNLY
jgi:hypothetical protein